MKKKKTLKSMHKVVIYNADYHTLEFSAFTPKFFFFNFFKLFDLIIHLQE